MNPRPKSSASGRHGLLAVWLLAVVWGLMAPGELRAAYPMSMSATVTYTPPLNAAPISTTIPNFKLANGTASFTLPLQAVGHPWVVSATIDDSKKKLSVTVSDPTLTPGAVPVTLYAATFDFELDTPIILFNSTINSTEAKLQIVINR